MIAKHKVRTCISLTAAILVGLAVMEVFRGPRSFFAGFDRGMQTRYDKISEGETRRTVFDALGEPKARSDEFNLPQRNGFEHLFDSAVKSPAVEYYQWINGMNWNYCIGFDSNGIVVMKGEGNS